MRYYKKTLMVALAVAFIWGSNDPFVEAKDFTGKESEMNSKCSVIYDSQTQQECEEYKAYLEQKNASLGQEIDAIKNQLNDVQGNIDRIGELVKENNEKLAQYDQEIKNIEGSIIQIENSIEELNAQILVKEESVAQRDEMMRKRLAEMQVYTGSNNFIDFLMGSSSFPDLLRRTQILGELNTYENEQVQALKKERDELSRNKDAVTEKKEMLIVQKATADNNKVKVEALNEVNSQMIATYHEKESDLLAERRAVQMAQASIPSIDTTLISPELDGDFDSGNTDGSNGETSNGDQGNGEETPDKPNDEGNSDDGNSSGGGNNSGGNNGGGGNSGGSGNTPSTSFISPIASGSWYYSAGTWAYPGGGYHLGMDFATYGNTGLPVVAPATGIVLYTYTGSNPTGGYLGNMTGVPAGAGNNITILVPVNGQVYAISFYHLTSVNASAGQTVSQGQVIAYTGNSGNSTGPHCHIEVINVGNMKLSQAVNIFNSNRDLTFGTGWGPDPRACGSAPCRLRPESFWL